MWAFITPAAFGRISGSGCAAISAMICSRSRSVLPLNMSCENRIIGFGGGAAGGGGASGNGIPASTRAFASCCSRAVMGLSLSAPLRCRETEQPASCGVSVYPRPHGQRGRQRARARGCPGVVTDGTGHHAGPLLLQPRERVGAGGSGANQYTEQLHQSEVVAFTSAKRAGSSFLTATASSTVLLLTLMVSAALSAVISSGEFSA